MDFLAKRMQAIAAELWDTARHFTRATRFGTATPATILLALQGHLDHLRHKVWQARKLCDPNLSPPRSLPAPDDSQSLTERILHLVDARKHDDAA